MFCDMFNKHENIINNCLNKINVHSNISCYCFSVIFRLLEFCDIYPNQKKSCVKTKIEQNKSCAGREGKDQ